ncbi:hypothetical protein CYMTET_32345, partial [Cymbomonas tetramitiformis]
MSPAEKDYLRHGDVVPMSDPLLMSIGELPELTKGDLYRYRRIKGQAPPAQSEANLKLIEARLRRISALNHPGGRSDWLKTIERRWNNRQGSVAIDPPLEEEEMSDDKAESVRSTPRDENDTELFTPPREFDSGYFIKPIRFYGDGQGTSVTPPTASEVSRKEISQEEKAQEDTGHPSAARRRWKMIRQSLGPLGGGGIQIDLVAVAKTVISEVKLHPEVAELIRRGDVITDVEDTSTIPIWRQGNMDMYTDESLAQRKELERDGSIRNAIEGFWSKLGYDESNKPTMAKHEFCNLYAMLVMTVTPENEETEEQLRIDAEEEWKNDIGSGAAMTLDQFIKSIFQLADHWTMDICASSYITFIRDLSTKVLKLKKARAAQAK